MLRNIAQFTSYLAILWVSMMPLQAWTQPVSYLISANEASLAELQSSYSTSFSRLTVEDLDLDTLQRKVRFHLDEIDIFDSRSSLIVDGRVISRMRGNNARYFRGTLVDEPESLVVVSLRPSGNFRGYISLKEQAWMLSHESNSEIIKSKIFSPSQPVSTNPFIDDVREIGLQVKQLPLEDIGYLKKKSGTRVSRPIRSGEIVRDLSGTAGWGKTFFLDVPSGQEYLSIQISGSLGTSVFVRKAIEPDGNEGSSGPNITSCRGEIWSPCKIFRPSAGRYFISLYAFQDFEKVSLRAAYEKALRDNELYEVTIGVDTDYDFFQLFHDVSEAEDYVAALFASVSLIYEREVNTRLKVGPLVLYTSTAEDPYVESSSECRLDEVSRYWDANFSDQQRATVTHLTARNFGGLAWRDAFCWSGYTTDYDPSDYDEACVYDGTEQVVGSFSVSGVDGITPAGSLQIDWDTKVVAHELGHNFGSAHTHCYAGVGGSSFPVDTCYAEEDSCWSGEVNYPGPNSLSGGNPGGKNGTIMSYCHTIQGGLQNIAGTFGMNHYYGIQPERVARLIGSKIASGFSSDPSCVRKISGTATSGYETVNAVAGEGGLISPSGKVPVLAGSTISFLLTPSDGYEIYRIKGSCGGVKSGNRYKTDIISSDCSVVVDFVEVDTSFVVTPSVNWGGTISPKHPQIIAEGDKQTFELSHYEGFKLSGVDGTCGGNLTGSTYTTDAVVADCSVVAMFEPIAGEFSESTVTSLVYKWDDSSCSEGSKAEGHGLVNESEYTLELLGFYALRQDGSIYWSDEFENADNLLNPGYLSAKGWCVSDDDRSPYGTDIYRTYWIFKNPVSRDEVSSDSLYWAPQSTEEYTVTPSASDGGKISPQESILVQHGDVAIFTLTPDVNRIVNGVTGSCGGALEDLTFTTNPISEDCTVTATFRVGQLMDLLIPATFCKMSQPTNSFKLQFKEWGLINKDEKAVTSVTCGIPRLSDLFGQISKNSQFSLYLSFRSTVPGSPSLLSTSCQLYEQSDGVSTLIQSTRITIGENIEATQEMFKQYSISETSNYTLMCDLPPDVGLTKIKVRTIN